MCVLEEVREEEEEEEERGGRVEEEGGRGKSGIQYIQEGPEIQEHFTYS